MSQNWSEIELDDTESLLKEIEEYGSAKERNTGTDKQSAGDKGNEGKVKASALSRDIQDEEDEEDELEDDTEGEEDLEEDSDDQDVENTGDGDKGGDAERTRLAKELADYKREVQQEVERTRRERDEALGKLSASEKQNSTLRTSQLETQRSSLDLEIKNLKTQIKKAKEDGDTDIELDLVGNLQEKTLRKLAVETAIEEAKDEKEVEIKVTKDTPKQQTQSAVPTEAIKFMERNKWIDGATPAVKNLIAATAQTLIDQGQDPSKVDFYDNLEKKLGRVLEDTNYKVSPRVKPTVKAKGSPVAGKEQASEKDTRTQVTKTKDGKTKVKVTKEDVAAAERLGMEPRDYIKSKVKTERQTGGNYGNWATIEV